MIIFWTQKFLVIRRNFYPRRIFYQDHQISKGSLKRLFFTILGFPKLISKNDFKRFLQPEWEYEYPLRLAKYS